MQKSYMASAVINNYLRIVYYTYDIYVITMLTAVVCTRTCTFIGIHNNLSLIFLSDNSSYMLPIGNLSKLVHHSWGRNFYYNCTHKNQVYYDIVDHSCEYHLHIRWYLYDKNEKKCKTLAKGLFYCYDSAKCTLHGFHETALTLWINDILITSPTLKKNQKHLHACIHWSWACMV